ncbi:hypothetical protein CEUSTIGMA_g3209.t1 [Chlamydomonas eustigma]|uniref:FCP1 homology domain-containing protein n=1 Tax=Chlamydomonas eustigma TaxID=1157962 RepID=A0A250WYA6_9CHLO|nr:hypothetical protein CEUSTIGMA_g3209.t1 [Chlamydomonas eustigma]|eukprot:GAX75766.1 hypothetical protein CEUSTIGMA_g3209.t1 [Chlamydomonas eustigma]
MDAYSAYSSEDEESMQNSKYGGPVELNICNVISVQEHKTEAFRDPPLILFDLNGVLVDESKRVNGRRGLITVRPQVELILRLLPRFRVGIFSSATSWTVNGALIVIKKSLNDCLTNSAEREDMTLEEVFDPVLHREHCSPDLQWTSRPGGRSHDTVKPLAVNGFDLSNTILVDNEACKAAPGEESNIIILPSWEHCSDKGNLTWRTLISKLLMIPASCKDVRTEILSITQHLSSDNAAMASSPLLLDNEQQQGYQASMKGLSYDCKIRPSLPIQRADTQGLPAHATEQIFLPEDDVMIDKDHVSMALPACKRQRIGEGQDVNGLQSVQPLMMAPSSQPVINTMVQGQTSDLMRGEHLRGSCAQDHKDSGLWLSAVESVVEEGDGHDGLIPQQAAAYQDLLRQLDSGHDYPMGQKRGQGLAGAVPLCTASLGFSYRESRHAGISDDIEMRKKRSRSHLSALHEEIKSFSLRAQPTPQEIQMLSKAMSKIRSVTLSLWPQARTKLFGSQACGLALPGSDLDVVILGVVPDLTTPATGFSGHSKSRVVRCLRKLSKALKKAGMIRNMELIAKAKVPIIKVMLVGISKGMPPIPVDISMGVANGATAVSMVRRAVLDLPPLLPLCLVIKALLRESRLNEVYSGGLSSYSIVNMIIAHLQCEGFDASNVISESVVLPAAVSQGSRHQHITKDSGDDDEQGHTCSSDHDTSDDAAEDYHGKAVIQPASHHLEAVPEFKTPETQINEAGPGSFHGAEGDLVSYLQQLPSLSYSPFDLGMLLTTFLHRFGNVMNYRREAVSIKNGGIIERPWAWNQKGQILLGVEDPQQAGRDIGANSFNVESVRQVFTEALEALRDGQQAHVSASKQNFAVQGQKKPGATTPAGPANSRSRVEHTSSAAPLLPLPGRHLRDDDRFDFPRVHVAMSRKEDCNIKLDTRAQMMRGGTKLSNSYNIDERLGMGHGYAEAVEEEAQDLEKWATIQRDGQSSSVTAAPSTTSAAPHARSQQALIGAVSDLSTQQNPGSEAVAAGGGGSVPSLLDYILDVDAALERKNISISGSSPRHGQKQQQHPAVPRLQQRQDWLRSQGRPSYRAACCFHSSPGAGRGTRGGGSRSVHQTRSVEDGNKGLMTRVNRVPPASVQWPLQEMTGYKRKRATQDYQQGSLQHPLQQSNEELQGHPQSKKFRVVGRSTYQTVVGPSSYQTTQKRVNRGDNRNYLSPNSSEIEMTRYEAVQVLNEVKSGGFRGAGMTKRAAKELHQKMAGAGVHVTKRQLSGIQKTKKKGKPAANKGPDQKHLSASPDSKSKKRASKNKHNGVPARRGWLMV